MYNLFRAVGGNRSAHSSEKSKELAREQRRSLRKYAIWPERSRG